MAEQILLPIGKFLLTGTTLAMVIGTGASISEKLTNNILNSLIVVFNSGKSTLLAVAAPAMATPEQSGGEIKRFLSFAETS